MKTGYTFTVTKDNEVIFAKDKESEIYTPMEELTLSIAESFDMADVDAEEYAKKLKYLCLTEYSNELRCRA